MASATVKGCCWVLLLMLVALYADFHKVIGQQTTIHNAVGGNELHNSLDSITEQLTQVMKSLTELQQEHTRMSQNIVEMRRQQTESDTALRTGFERVGREGTCLKDDIAAIMGLLVDGVHKDNATHSAIDSVRQDNAEFKQELKDEVAEMKKLVRREGAACKNDLAVLKVLLDDLISTDNLTYLVISSLKQDSMERDQTLKSDVDEVKELVMGGRVDLKDDLAAMKAVLDGRLYFENVTHSNIIDLKQESAEFKQEFRSDVADIKELVFNSTAVGLQLERKCAEMKSDLKSDIADVKTHLNFISAYRTNTDNETRVRIEQLNEGQVKLRTDLEKTVMDVKQQVLQQLNATTEFIHAGRQSDSESCSNQTKPRDCGDVMNLGSTSSGSYMVYAGRTLRPLMVYCDMTTYNGGWTVFQRRQDGSENFYRTWLDYANGFGDLYGEFWLGNDNLHSLTTDGRRYKLRVDLADFNGSTRYAEYSDFKLGASWEKYKLASLGSYSGDAGDALGGHVGFKFSAHDQDNDIHPGTACAVEYKGAWWYSQCHSSNLNGYYYGGHHESYADGIEWNAWTGYYYSLRLTEMKVRPNNM